MCSSLKRWKNNFMAESKMAIPHVCISASQAFFHMMLMNCENYIGFLCNNYIPMTVKGLEGRHVDFEFDGIYDCRETPFERLTIIGKCCDVKDIIDNSVKKGVYVIVTRRQEENRDYGDAARYNNFWLVSGQNHQKGTYKLYSYGDEHKIVYYEMDCKTFTDGYLRQEAEWDFEIYLFRRKAGYEEEIDKKLILSQIHKYISGKSAAEDASADFFAGKIKNYEMQCGFSGKNGIEVYDFLTEQVKNKKITNTRSFEALLEHKMITRIIYQNVLNEKYSNLTGEVDELVLCAQEALRISEKYIDEVNRKVIRSLSLIIKELRHKEILLMQRIAQLINA